MSTDKTKSAHPSGDRGPDRARTVSVMLGMMIGPDGQPRRAYRALRDLTCARCSALIPEGTTFGRRSGLMNVPQSFPYCQTCLPLRSLSGEGSGSGEGHKEKT